jgi:hypothetical protein
MKIARYPGLLNFMNYRYPIRFSVLVVTALATYLFAPIGSETYGGSWVGYLLGIVSALIVLMLIWYGIAKRHLPRHRATKPGKRTLRHRADLWRSTQQGRLSLHINLGGSLIVFATLHTGFQFGWNIHTLSYVLMLMTILSGFYGLYAYLRLPRLLTRNACGVTLDELRHEISKQDELARAHALGLSDEMNLLIRKARLETRLGGNLVQQLSGRQINCPTTSAVRQILKIGSRNIENEERGLLRDLYSVLLCKESLVLRARRDIMLKARMKIWLYLHVPLSIALLAALLAHILSILFFW